MSLQPKQEQALNLLLTPQCKYLLYGGAMAGGKSYLLRWAALYYSLWLSQKTGIQGIPIGLFSEDYPTLKDRQISRIIREFPDWIGRLKDSQEDGFAFFIHPAYGGGRILLRNLDDPSKYMSSEFAGIFVEELTRNSEQTFQDLRNRLRYPGIEQVKFLGASNPGGIGHAWVKKYFVEHERDDPEADRFSYVHANAYDNAYISPNYIKQLEALPEQKRKAYLEGSWDIFEGQFFSNFRPSLHVIKPFLPRNMVIVSGMDWGTTAPFVCEFSALEKIVYKETSFYRMYTFLEVTGNDKTPKQWADEIKKKLAQFNLTIQQVGWIRGDPSMFTKGNDMSLSIAGQFLREGIMVKPASNDRVGGWVAVNQWLSLAPDGLPYWQIAGNCVDLITSLPALIYDENNVEDVDTDGPDHWADAVRYCMKHLKWIDARSGGVGKSVPLVRPKYTATMVDGKQLPIDLDKFSTVRKRVYYR